MGPIALSFADCPNFDGDNGLKHLRHETFLQQVCIFFTNPSRRYKLPFPSFAPDSLPNLTKTDLQTCPLTRGNSTRPAVNRFCLSHLCVVSCDRVLDRLNAPVS
jgi:hypothetical protein